MIWNNTLYIDTVLPFGLRSAQKFLTPSRLAFSGSQRGVSFLDHFLGDFITAAALEADCACNLYL
jgi:hypothetical protein